VGQSRGNPDAIEVALANALEGATAAARWDVVAQLAKELEARRVARSSGKIVAMDEARRGRPRTGGRTP
jgi:hypothetical protein